ncbi:MAG TPA: DGQHR domain-containing protein [Verrucomicrobiae bacterium]|nr:DGQHR domain-containing protein [Verrucomicrobiae bacterium]
MSEHIEFPCVEVKQGDRTRLYLGSIQFGTLFPLFTVTPRTPRTDDPYFADTPEVLTRYPQRPEKEDRLREIAKFVEQRLIDNGQSRKEVIFPSTVILGLLVDCEVDDKRPECPSPACAYLVGESSSWAKLVLLPKKDNSLFVIDGQHRLKGLRQLMQRLDAELHQFEGRTLTPEQLEQQKRKQKLAEAVRTFEVPVSLLLDFDLEEQAMVFATVNFNQKPVQRSFYFDIFGAFESDKVTPLSFTHEFVVHLNNAETSPLKGMIKLLGTGPGLVSQAFMVERLVPLGDPQNPKSVFRTFYQLRYKGEMSASKQFASIVKNMFEAVRTEFPYAWPHRNAKGNYSSHSYDFILCKSMVMSGLLGVLREIYKLVLLDFAAGKEIEVATAEALSPTFFAELLRKIDPEGRNQAQKSVFSRQAAWAVGGSAKIEKTIFEALRSQILSAYVEATANDKSEYSKLRTQFNGAGNAMELLKNTQPSAYAGFWFKTEIEWEKLIGKRVEPLAS